MDNFPLPRWAINGLLILFAVMGGMLGHTVRENDKGNPISLGRVLLEGGSSGFVGVLVLFLCTEMKLSFPITGFIVGILGWAGAVSAIRLLRRFLPERLVPPAANRDTEI